MRLTLVSGSHHSLDGRTSWFCVEALIKNKWICDCNCEPFVYALVLINMLLCRIAKQFCNGFLISKQLDQHWKENHLADLGLLEQQKICGGPLSNLQCIPHINMQLHLGFMIGVYTEFLTGNLKFIPIKW